MLFLKYSSQEDTYVRYESNLVQVVAELRVVERNHLREDRQIFWRSKEYERSAVCTSARNTFTTLYPWQDKHFAQSSAREQNKAILLQKC